MGGILLVLPAFYVWPSLQFRPSPGSNRLTDYAMAIAVGAPFSIGIVLLGYALRWLLFFLWPTSMGITADHHALHFLLGPFGKHHLDWARMEMIYAFEYDDPSEADPDLLGIEPEDEMQSYLPKMRHPLLEGDVNRLFERFTTVEQSKLAAALLPYIQRIRGES